MISFVDQLRRIKEGMDCPCIIVGNKRDIAVDGYRQVTMRDLISFSNVWLNRCPVLEVSATDGKKVEEAFSILMKEIRSLHSKLMMSAIHNGSRQKHTIESSSPFGERVYMQ